MTEKPDSAELKSMNASVIDDFRANSGRVGGQFAGADMLLLTTTGAKSGHLRTSPLVYENIDGKMLIMGSYRGADVHPSWVHNLRKNPQAHIEVGAESYDVVARELPPDEHEKVWQQLIAVAPWFGEYQKLTSRVIPLFELTRA
jgi:deazaflavin-dependent oxidoreductase (nitroreductase family)